MSDSMDSAIGRFRRSIEAGHPPDGPPLLLALWHDARGDWDEAHRIAQGIESADAAKIHAYLHRREGDLGNARYWYQRARCRESTDSLESEWLRLVAPFL